MPPNAARGAGRGRGRGRGRGGKAPAADASPALAPEAKDEAESQSTIADTPMVDAEPATSTTPTHEQEQNDPNSSPATQPTETPAPTPVRLPPTISNTNSTAASGSGTRGTGAPKPSKFKPKIVRANAKEREEREAREREKENAKLGVAAAAAARAARGTWGRGRGGRGRGDAMGRGRGVQTSGVASGPFAEAPADRKGFFSGSGGAIKREGGSGYSRGTGGGASGSAIKTEGGGFAHNGNGGGSHDPVAGRYMPDPQYPDEDEDAPRVDIEHINEQSDSEEDVVLTGVRSLNKGKGKVSNKGGLKPIRLDRKEHKDRVTMVNTEPAVKSAPEDEDPDAMIVDEGRSSKAVPYKRKWQGTYVDEEVKIKSEPGIVPQMSYSREPTASSPPPSKFKASIEIGDEDPDIELIKSEPISPRLERKAKPRRPSQKKSKVPVMQTEEDRAEWDRHLEDIEVLRKELRGLTAQPKNTGKDVENGIDVAMEGTAAQEEPEQEKEDGRVYLFQFPPVLPKLYDDTTSANPNMASYDDNVEMVSFDLTKDDKTEIKSEEKVMEIKQEELDEDELKKQKEREKLVVEEGVIGKLVLRESGDVELVWGGTNMKVGRGIETNFFSVAAVIDGQDQWQKEDKGRDIPALGGSRGRSMAMGELMGKFVVSPDWTNIR